MEDGATSFVGKSNSGVAGVGVINSHGSILSDSWVTENFGGHDVVSFSTVALLSLGVSEEDVNLFVTFFCGGDYSLGVGRLSRTGKSDLV